MGMGLLLVRHAEAVNDGPGLVDEHRYLSWGGRAAARALGAELLAARAAVDRVYTSPLVRAVQTAELVVAALGLELEIVATPLLSPGGSVRRAAELLDGADALAMAVGHEPSISALGGLMSRDPRFPAMRTSEACLIEDGQIRRWLGSDRRRGG
jgi:phosphohistidine phosphatase